MDKKLHLYDRIEKRVSANTSHAQIIYADGKTETVYPFMYQPIEVKYDDEGLETVKAIDNAYTCIRYTAKYTGKMTVKLYADECVEETFEVSAGQNHGFIKVSEKDSRYFEYTDKTPYIPVGVNMAFPSTYEKSDGSEFGVSGKFRYIGLRQYERWFKKAAQSGVNMVRVWIGHPYFSPDTETAYELDLVNMSKIDELIRLATKYDIKLKLTLENFRFFDYERVADTNSYSDDVFRKFNKRLYIDGNRCPSMQEWVQDEKYAKAWLYKVGELAKRFSGDTTIFAIELWNENNTVHCPIKCAYEWNEKYMSVVDDMFPEHMVVNSLGSFESDKVKELYDSFCWDKCAFKQVHRYLDQGASCKICSESPIEFLEDAYIQLKPANKPFIVAETGAVNNCHSGPFKFYENDDDGIIFADCVYTPFFVGSAGCGHIWHWDQRYVESKSLYKMFKPFADVVRDIDAPTEEFVPMNLSDSNAFILVLKGKNHVLGYIRNKTADWKNMLRDLNDYTEIPDIKLHFDNINSSEVVRIWDDNTSIISDTTSVTFSKIGYGCMFRLELNTSGMDAV